MRTDSRRTHNPFNALMVLVTAGVVFFAIYARQTAHEFLFRPPPASYERDSSFEYFVADDGVELNVFWEGAGEDAWTVLYLCGSEEDLSMAMPKLRNYQLKGYNVASFEYRGYVFTEGPRMNPTYTQTRVWCTTICSGIRESTSPDWSCMVDQ